MDQSQINTSDAQVASQQNSYFNHVKSLSKILAAVVLITLPFLGFWLGTFYVNQEKQSLLLTNSTPEEPATQTLVKTTESDSFAVDTLIKRSELNALIQANKANPGFYESHPPYPAESEINNGLHLVVIPFLEKDLSLDPNWEPEGPGAGDGKLYRFNVYLYVGNEECNNNCSIYSGRGTGEELYSLIYSYEGGSSAGNIIKYITLQDNYYNLRGDAVLLINDRWGQCCDASYYLNNTILYYSPSDKKTYIYNLSDLNNKDWKTFLSDLYI